jgi:hypothetical protein
VNTLRIGYVDGFRPAGRHSASRSKASRFFIWMRRSTTSTVPLFRNSIMALLTVALSTLIIVPSCRWV